MTENEKLTSLLKRLEHPALKTIDLSLQRMHRLLSALGNPEQRLPPVIHIAGTNGKGSLAAYLTAILQAGGYRVHRYISPHLIRFGERITVAGKDIDDGSLFAVLTRIEDAVEQHPATFFEATTAAAFLAFAETQADIVILETGLGGRLDATNVIENPLLTVITPIAIDHQEYLGNTLEEIAFEKSGILKMKTTCVIGPQSESTIQVLEAVAKKLNAPVIRHGKEWRYDACGRAFTFASGAERLEDLSPALEGAHQNGNAATAVACIRAIHPSFPVTEDAVRYGIANVCWPGRLQRLTTGPLIKGMAPDDELWLDGGHNAHAANMLAEWATQRHASSPKSFFLILGMLKNKDRAAFLKAWAEAPISRIMTVPVRGEPVGEVEILARMAKYEGFSAHSFASVSQAMLEISKTAHYPKRILIAGSLYLAGEVLEENT